MNKLSRAVAVLLAAGALLLSTAWASDSATRAVLFSDLSSGSIEVTYQEATWPDHDQLPKRTLTFFSVNYGKKKVLSAIDVPDQLLSIFRLSDDDDLVFTTWTTGSAYRVRVFIFDGVAINEVLDLGSKAMPGFVTVDASPAVLVHTTAKDSKWAAYIWADGKFVKKSAALSVSQP